MKIVLDIDKLLAGGQITADEHERLKGFSHKETGSLAFNILIGFGVIATAGGAFAFVFDGDRLGHSFGRYGIFSDSYAG